MKRIRFFKAQLAESSEEIPNPGIGWYHIYTWQIAPPYPNFFYLVEETETLVLLLLEIGAFRSESLPAEALSCIESILEFYHVHGRQMILRFVYDTEGTCIQKEPPEKSIVKTHMRQIGTLLQKHKDAIACIQGILVGNWGEMHGSRYLSEDTMTELTEMLDAAVDHACLLAVRKPAQHRAIEDHSERSGISRRIGLFNDGIFGSETDLGTYQVLGREQELEWQQEHMQNTYNGGEALAGNSLIGYRDAVKDLQKMHLSYLNSIYQAEQLQHWKSETVQEDTCWNKVSGYDYIGRHLGYRFVIRDACLNRRKILSVQIENVGFANLCKEADCFLITEDFSGKKASRKIITDARTWNSGEIHTITANLEGISDPPHTTGSYRICIRLCLKSTGDVIRFANCGAGNSCQLGRIEFL